MKFKKFILVSSIIITLFTGNVFADEINSNLEKNTVIEVSGKILPTSENIIIQSEKPILKPVDIESENPKTGDYSLVFMAFLFIFSLFYLIRINLKNI